MNMYTKRRIIVVARVILLVFFMCMIIYGQRTISYASTGLMLVGLAGLLVLLYLYNRSQVKIEPMNDGYEAKKKAEDE